MKKIAAVVLASVMAAALFAGCGSSSSGSASSDSAQTETKETAAAEETTAAEETAEATAATGETPDGSWPAETVKIGVEVYDTTDSNVIAYMEYYEYLEDYYNVEFMFSESVGSAEEELAFAESCAAAGCVGYIGGYNASMETIVEKVTDLGMYYWGAERGLDEVFADNEYYLGGMETVSSDASVDSSKGGDYLVGYSMAMKLAEQGAKHVVFCSGGSQMGIPMFIDRLAGFTEGIEAAKKAGYEIEWDPSEDDIAGWPGTDDFAAAQSNAISKDYDAVACSFSGFEIWAQPLNDAGKTDVKVAGVGSVDGTLSDLFESGFISLIIYECPEIVFGQAVPMILDAVEGGSDLIKGDKGYLACEIERWYIEDADTYNAIYDFHESGNFYVTPEEMTSIMVGYNEDVTAKDINDFYVAKTLDACVK